MQAPQIVRLDKTRLGELIEKFGGEHTPTVYTDRRFLVRELFWRRLQALMALSRATRRERVLDFGGGNGILLSTLSLAYREVHCVDEEATIARHIIEERGLDNVSLQEADLLGLELPTGSFDTIVAADVLEHLTEPEAVVREFRRLLVPGGELLVSLPTENRFYELGRRVFGYTKPHDHYHHAAGVESIVGRVLAPERQRHWPLDLSILGVFSLARFVSPPR